MNFGRFAEIMLRVAAPVAALLFMSLGTLPGRAEPKWPLPEGMKSTEVNGYDMAYQESGAGAPLVLVHGALSDYRIWAAVARNIPSGFES